MPLQSTSRQLQPDTAAGYHCFCGCPVPLPETLTLTDPVFGEITLTYQESDILGFNWYGARDVTSPVATRAHGDCNTLGGSTTPIVYAASCSGGTDMGASILYSECTDLSVTNYLTDAPANVDFADWPFSPSAGVGHTPTYDCDPRDATFSVTFSANGAVLYGSAGPHTFRIREVA